MVRAQGYNLFSPSPSSYSLFTSSSFHGIIILRRCQKLESIGSYGRMTDEWRMGSGSGLSELIFRNMLEGLRKRKGNLGEDIRCPDRDLGRASPACKPVCLASFSNSLPPLCSSPFPSFLIPSFHYFHKLLYFCPFIFCFFRFLLFSFLYLSVPIVFFVIFSCFLCALSLPLPSSPWLLHFQSHLLVSILLPPPLLTLRSPQILNPPNRAFRIRQEHAEEKEKEREAEEH
jgi:hypothetical protein